MRTGKSTREQLDPVCNFYPHFWSIHFVTSNPGVVSNPGSRGNRHAGEEQDGAIGAPVNFFPDACKKSLAFRAQVGVASATVQGLRLVPSTLDGGATRDFQKLVWSESANCGGWRYLSASASRCLRSPVPYSLHPIKTQSKSVVCSAFCPT